MKHRKNKREGGTIVKNKILKCSKSICYEKGYIPKGTIFEIIAFPRRKNKTFTIRPLCFPDEIDNLHKKLIALGTDVPLNKSLIYSHFLTNSNKEHDHKDIVVSTVKISKVDSELFNECKVIRRTNQIKITTQSSKSSKEIITVKHRKQSINDFEEFIRRYFFIGQIIILKCFNHKKIEICNVERSGDDVYVSAKENRRDEFNLILNNKYTYIENVSNHRIKHVMNTDKVRSLFDFSKHK